MGNADSYCSNPNDLLSAITATLFFILNPFTYRGYFYDAESNIYYLQSRYYIPEWGRFLNADDAQVLELSQNDISAANLFEYCGNNPVNNVDPTGDWYKTYAVSIIYGYDYEDGVNKLEVGAKYLRDDFYDIFNYVKVDMDLFKNKQKFKDAWNALSNQDIVVLLCHGDPVSLTSSMSTAYLNKELHYKKIKCLIILSCYSGHFGFIWNNIACTLSQKISGIVVASDGRVQPSTYHHKFYSNTSADSWEFWRDHKRSENKWMKKTMVGFSIKLKMEQLLAGIATIYILLQCQV